MFSQSPFDEALSRPFMADDNESPWNEKKKTKFSWTSVASTVFSMDDDDDDTYETYEAPLVVVPLGNHDDNDIDVDDPPPPPPPPPMSLQYQVSMGDVSELTHDLERAVLQERHSDIQEICMDMKTLHGIQQDFAQIVDSQDYDIKRMSWLAIEAFEETECGLAQLETTTSSRNTMMGQQRHKEKLVKTAAVVGFTVLTIAWAVSKLYYSNACAIHGHSGDPQTFP